METTGRGSGRTTRQIQALPEGAVFVVAAEPQRQHTVRLACGLGRPDVQVVTLAWVRAQRWRGLTYSGADVDHHAADVATGADREEIANLRTRVRPGL